MLQNIATARIILSETKMNKNNGDSEMVKISQKNPQRSITIKIRTRTKSTIQTKIINRKTRRIKLIMKRSKDKEKMKINKINTASTTRINNNPMADKVTKESSTIKLTVLGTLLIKLGFAP